MVDAHEHAVSDACSLAQSRLFIDVEQSQATKGTWHDEMPQATKFIQILATKELPTEFQ